MKKIALQQNLLDVGDAFSFLQTPRAGGVILFVGTTRQWTGERETIRLSYDCYEAMALQEMHRLVDEVQRKWPVERVYLIHRLGDVPYGEASVIVGIASPHRDEAFAASRFLIDRLKEQVPIWKKEHYADGGTEWVQGKDLPRINDRVSDT